MCSVFTFYSSFYVAIQVYISVILVSLMIIREIYNFPLCSKLSENSYRQLYKFIFAPPPPLQFLYKQNNSADISYEV